MTTASPSSASPTFFFFHATATTDIYTLSLHDALPICPSPRADVGGPRSLRRADVPLLRPELHHERPGHRGGAARDRKSTRLNSSHVKISYAVFCLKKKKKSINATSSYSLTSKIL